MIIGTPPGAALRAIGEVDYETARIVAGRGLTPDDAHVRVAVVGRLYARQRLGIADPTATPRSGQQVTLGGHPFTVVGVYSTANDFGDNHVFVPIEAQDARARDVRWRSGSAARPGAPSSSR